jgi:hypothetical protein
MEAAFNNFLGEYLEVYLSDIDHAVPLSGDTTIDALLWKGELQSWKDYTDHLRNDSGPLETPAGLTVDRHTDSGTVVNTVSWDAVHGADHYIIQRMALDTTPAVWVDAGCNNPTSTSCTDSHQWTGPYAYSVQASNADGTKTTDPAYVAVFLSEATYDGYVSETGSMHSAVSNATDPGIWAGHNATTSYKGFLSFNTSTLAGKMVLDAKLRLYQMNDNTLFDHLGPCMVDVQKGSFSNNRVLETSDYIASSSQQDAARIRPMDASQTAPDWVEAELLPQYLQYINNSTTLMGRTQFRLRFDGSGSADTGKWYAGESVGGSPSTPPQLIVRYVPSP